MKKHLICLALLFCLIELSAQSVEYEFENSKDPVAFQEFKKSSLYAKYKEYYDPASMLLWKHISERVTVVVIVQDSKRGLSYFTIKFYAWDDSWDDATWRYANELKYSTKDSQLVPAKIAKDGKVITIYSQSGDVIISTEIPGMIFPGGK